MKCTKSIDDMGAPVRITWIQDFHHSSLQRAETIFGGYDFFVLFIQKALMIWVPPA